MVAVKGIYEGGNIVRIDDSELAITEPYEVVVSFLQPAKNSEKTLRFDEQGDLQEGQEGLKILKTYYKTLRADFDYKKERAEWREERYGNTH